MLLLFIKSTICIQIESFKQTCYLKKKQTKNRPNGLSLRSIIWLIFFFFLGGVIRMTYNPPKQKKTPVIQLFFLPNSTAMKLIQIFGGSVNEV